VTIIPGSEIMLLKSIIEREVIFKIAIRQCCDHGASEQSVARCQAMISSLSSNAPTAGAQCFVQNMFTK
jgi:hypothetical protein